MPFFDVLFYQPILNLLVWLHNTIPGNDFGWAIIGMTVVVKILLLPLSAKSLRSQKALQDLQPKVDALRKEYTNDKEELGRKMMELYRNEKVSPFSSCLPLLIQLPFLIAIFQVLRDGVSTLTTNGLYPFVASPGVVDTNFLGFIDLSERSILLAVAAGIIQFLQTKMLTHRKQPQVPGSKDESMASMVNKQMMYMMPVLTIVLGATFPGGLTLYWFMNTLITFVQQEMVLRKDGRKEAHP